MWPWTHAALGYVTYSLGSRAGLTPLADRPVVLLAVGTQFPDLVDKPLAYVFGVLPEGRALAHSLFAFVGLAAGLWVLGRRWRRLTGPFLVGYATHLLGDAWWPLVGGRFGRLSWLLWPLLEPPAYPAASFLHHYERLLGILTGGSAVELLASRPNFFGGLALTAGVVWLWVADGTPGLRWLRTVARR